MQPEEDHFTGKLDWSLWKRLARFGIPYKRYVIALMTMGVLVALFDISLPILVARIIDHVMTNGPRQDLYRIVTIYLGLWIAFAITIYTFICVAGWIHTSIAHDIREAAFNKLQELPFSYFDRRAVGWLMARLTGDCGNLSRVMAWSLLDLAWAPVVMSTSAIAMLIWNWKLALIVLSIFIPVYFIARFFQVRLLLTSRALRKANSITTGAYNEGIVGVKTSKSLVREQRNGEEFSELTETMYTHALKNQVYAAMFQPFVVSLVSLGVGLALWNGGANVLAGAITVGTLVAFIQYANLLQHPAQELANTITMIQGAQASAERILGLLDEPLEIADSPEVISRLASHSFNGDSPLAPDGYEQKIDTIEFRDVTFAYKTGPTVLHSFDLTVRAGESIALVGATGGGKSTIVSLVCRFYEPTTGEVRINGVDYRKRSLHWLQGNLGMVLQQPFLFSGTVRENIRYGKLTATNEQIEEAARLSKAHEFIVELPDKYEAKVGEGGNQLSTGQKQLIALARAILADPQIFVLDEATSSVDTQTERAIQQAVEQAMQGRISFVIAHRLSTIKRCDRILVIDAGRIVEQGSHHDLLANKGRYYELYTQQFTTEHEEHLLHSEVAVK